MLRELKIGETDQMELVCDNQEGLHVASDSVSHERNKDTEIDCYFIRENILPQDIATKFVKSSN